MKEGLIYTEIELKKNLDTTISPNDFLGLKNFIFRK